MHTPSPTPRTHPTVGIDLGTTNSVIALLDDAGALRAGRDEQGLPTLPSVIGQDAGGQPVAGRAALAPAGALPLSSVKRYMGLDHTFAVGPRSLTPPEASAVVLRALRDAMARTLADPRQVIDHAVLTMPAYFNHNQIEATRRAGALAGYEVVELLHEPTAAAIYYSWALNHGDATYLVYDLGGGTFDVSVIRRRLGDYEVLAVSGDPFLGGDDFDRLLATHLVQTGAWAWAGPAAEAPPVARLFDPTSYEGAGPFARLVRLAESVKTELTAAEAVDRWVPRVLSEGGRELSLQATVTRAAFNRLIKDKIDRTIACCHEALGRARERVGLALSDVDHVILVGGSSRVPLVREAVQAAFCSPDRPEHARNPMPLLHEPDLCVAYGAALRAAGHGTRYRFPAGPEGSLELHLTSPASTREASYQAAGVVRLLGAGGTPPGPQATPPPGPLPEAERGSQTSGLPLSASGRGPGGAGVPPLLEGGSVRIRPLATGLVEEAFLDGHGAFAHELPLEPEADNALEWTVCDADARACGSVVTVVRCRAQGRPLGQGVLPTQLIVKPLSIEVLGRGRQRVKQVVAPVGAPLPGVFSCVCRTADQSGRVVVPVFEENRVVHQLVLEHLDRTLPAGSPVEVQFAIDARHAVEVSVRVRLGGGLDRCEKAAIEPPPPPGRPTRGDIEQAGAALEAALGQLSGRSRARFRARAEQVRRDLLEALGYDDEPKAVQRMAELRDLLQQAELARGQALEPPWPRFAALVRQCLDLAAEVATRTGRDRDELFEHVHAQERYAEEAFDDHNQPLYRECTDNLTRYAGYLEQLLRDSLPRPAAAPPRPPEEEARDTVDRFRAVLSSVWKQARTRGRADLEARLAEVAKQASGFTGRLKADPVGVLRDARRLGVEVEKVRTALGQPAGQTPPEGEGLLEGSS